MFAVDARSFQTPPALARRDHPSVPAPCQRCRQAVSTTEGRPRHSHSGARGSGCSKRGLSPLPVFTMRSPPVAKPRPFISGDCDEVGGGHDHADGGSGLHRCRQSPAVRRGDPVFDDATLDMDRRGSEPQIAEAAAGLLVAHLIGRPIDPDAARRLRNRARLEEIEDAFQAADMTSSSFPAGACGRITAYSFHEQKPLPMGGNGWMLATATIPSAGMSGATRSGAPGPTRLADEPATRLRLPSYGTTGSYRTRAVARTFCDAGTTPRDRKPVDRPAKRRASSQDAAQTNRT